MRLADLIDLETRLTLDAGADPAELRARDRAIGAALPAGAARGTPALEEWLSALRQRAPAQLFPGRALERALRWLKLGLGLSGLIAGWGLAEALLYFDGRQPVNVLGYLGVFVGLQILLLLLLLAALLAPGPIGRLPLVREIQGLLRWLAHAAARRAGAASGRAEEWRAALRRLASRRSLYRGVEPWLLLELTQILGVAFNAGALLCCLRLVTFSDLAFAWATTLARLDAELLHGTVRALAAPWAWLAPDAVPSLELVRETHYSRLHEAYLAAGARRAADPLLVGGWWPFLLLATAVYGLLPRAVALAVARGRAAWALGHLRLDDMEVRRLLDRLARPQVETRALQPEPGPEPPAGAAVDGRLVRAGAAARCTLVLWRDAPHGDRFERAVATALGWSVGEVHRVDGSDLEAERRACDALASPPARGAPVLVAAEAWEAPDKATLRLLRCLRAAAGERVPIAIGLLPTDAEQTPRAEDVQTWRDRLTVLGDPFVGVEPLEMAP
ncbi:MAG: DUF2868 domain-containing protein [Deltaproteobacteria bacterium]|nr:DUF2868 domain-containing protein [Deltaproteobacteria bacterium]